MIWGIACLLSVVSISARAESFTIQNYRVDAVIHRNSVVEIDEVLLVHFNQPRHGIIRKIPIRYRYSPVQGERASRPWLSDSLYTYDFFDTRVEPQPYSQSREGDSVVLKIGSAESMVNGDVTYRIHYKVFGGINFFSDHSEFYWNLVGNEWEVPIGAVSFSIRLPGPVELKPSDYFIYAGAYGTKKSDATLTPEFNGRENHLFGATTRPLNPREGVTVGIQFPPGYLESGNFWLQLQLFWANNPLFPLPLVVTWLCYLLWRKYGRDEDVVVAAEWQPPEGVTPAEAGWIVTDLVQPKHLTAMIFHWAAQGLLTIEEMKGLGLFGIGKDYLLTKKAALREAKEFERILFDGLFESGDSVRMDDLKEKYYVTLGAAKSALEGQSDQYFYSQSQGLRTLLYALAGLIPFVAVGSLVVFRGIQTQNAVFIGLCSLPLLFFGKYMPKKTKNGRELYQHILGFREFIDRVERPRLEAIIRGQPDYFDRTLAFAIVLGLGDGWAKKFDDLLTTPPSWYVGGNTGHFSTIAFMSSVNHSYAAMSDSMTSSPSQSGSGGSGFGGGGGGSSGGGGGGGGGSSW